MSVFAVKYKSEEGQDLLTLKVKASNSEAAVERVLRDFNLPKSSLTVELLPGVDNREADLL